jgi:hypothetical protein
MFVFNKVPAFHCRTIAFKARNFAFKSVLPHFRCSLETVAQRQPVEHTGVVSINPRTAEPEKRDRPNGL